MRSLEDARAAWNALQSRTSLDELKTSIRNDGPKGQPESNGLRSAQWKALLVLRTLEWSKWPERIGEARGAYASMKKQYLHGLYHQDEQDSLADPLSDDAQSPWNALRQDEQARQEIFQDVARCMPENLYFRRPETQEMLVDILFIWAKLHPDIAYRQGMHEILAPVLWVVERDAINPSSLVSKSANDDSCVVIFDAASIEHDAFMIFNAIMTGLQSAYAPPGPSANRQSAEPPIVPRSNHIVKHLLHQVDPALSMHLVDVDIAPQLFIMKWIRLLFGREFAFDDMLRMWDCIFVEDVSPAILDLVCVAMLLRIRWQLIHASYNETLTTLLRYSPLSQEYTAKTYVEDAVYLLNHLTPEAGSLLISKYTGKPPAPARRTVSPPGTPLMDRLKSPKLRSPVQRSPIHSRESSNLEGMLQNAARGVLSRGEVLNKAVKDAVGDFRENVQHLRPSRGESHLSGITNSTEGEIRKDQDLMQHIDELQARNKSLAKMLEKAVSELWKEHKIVTADKSAEDERTKSFTMAIAKVQLAQVYLDDSSLPLPPDEDTEKQNQGSKNGTTHDEASATNHTGKSMPEPASAESSFLSDFKLPTASMPSEGLTNQTMDDPFVNRAVRAPATRSTEQPTERPRLEQSSYSFMLGQDTVSPSPPQLSPAQPPYGQSSYPKPTGEQRESRGLDFLFGPSRESSFARRSIDSKRERKPAKKDAEVMFDADVMSDVKLND